MQIFKAISEVMGEIGAIGKNQKNQQQGFMYRGIDDVMNALQPVMVKYGVFVVPECLDHTREERTTKSGTTLLYSIVKVRFSFYAEDGSKVDAVTIGEGMDSGDKATNKAMASAFKYACFQVFCIPTQEMVDPDGESHDIAPTGNAYPAQQATSQQTTQRGGISEKQVKRLYAIAGNAGIDPTAVLKVIVHDYKKTKVEDLTREEYDDICGRLEAKA